jgi:hypothetical protein
MLPVPLAAGATTYSDTTGLEAAKSYTYRVSAIAPGGALASAAAVAATTFGETAVPTGVTCDGLFNEPDQSELDG